MIKNRISPYQNVTLLIIASFALQIISIPDFLIETQKTSGWITILIGGLIIGFVITIINKLQITYQHETIVNISDQLMPKKIAALIGLYYAAYYIFYTSYVLKEFIQVIKTFMLTKTPDSIIYLIFIVSAVYAARKGIETIARLSQIMIIISLIPYILLLISSISFTEYYNLLPIFSVKPVEIVKAVPYTFTGFFGFTILLFSNAFVTKQNQNLKTNKTYLKYGAFIYVIIYLIIIYTFGYDEAKQLIWPTVSIMKSVKLPGSFLENIEAISISLKIFNIFTFLSVVLYITGFVLKNTFNTNRSDYFLIILIPVIYLISKIMPVIEIQKYSLKSFVYVINIISLLIPIAIYFTHYIKKKKV